MAVPPYKRAPYYLWNEKHRHDNPSFARKRSRFWSLSQIQDPSYHKPDQSISKSCTCDPFNKFLFITFVSINYACISTIHVMIFSSLLSLCHATWLLSFLQTATKHIFTFFHSQIGEFQLHVKAIDSKFYRFIFPIMYHIKNYHLEMITIITSIIIKSSMHFAEIL